MATKGFQVVNPRIRHLQLQEAGLPTLYWGPSAQRERQEMPASLPQVHQPVKRQLLPRAGAHEAGVLFPESSLL